MVDNNNIQFYLDKGFKVFPIHGITPAGNCTCGKPDCGKTSGKHPITQKGLHDAVSTLSAYQSILNNRQGYNIAIPTGKASHIFVLDVDGPEGLESLQSLEALHGPLPQTSTQSTGKGRHIIFKHPGTSFKVKNSVRSLGNGLDIRGDGGYIVAAPSKHLMGHNYQWHDAPLADAPFWLLNLVVEAPEQHSTHYAPAVYEKASKEDIASALNYISPDIDYQGWINVGMALHNAGEPLSVWDTWSARGGKYKPKCCNPHWKSFAGKSNPITIATLFKMAMDGGWLPASTPTDNTPNPAQGFIDSLAVPSIKVNSDKLPITSDTFTPDHTILPPIIRDTVAYILSKAVQPQPTLAIMNTIAALGAVFGRRYQSSTGFRTNIYMVGIAPTGAGKEQSRKIIKDIFLQSGLNDILGGDKIRSAEGLVTMLAKYPRRIIHLDEIGMFLQAIGHKNAQGYERKISQTLTQLYSDSQSGHDSGFYASKETESPVISNPNLCIYGTTTLNKYTDALQREAIQSGELNRYIILSGDDTPPFTSKPSVAPLSDTLLKKWTDIRDAVLSHGGSLADEANVSPSPLVVEDSTACTECFERLFKYQISQSRENGAEYGPLWIRYAENVTKVAMIVAIARSPNEPVIQESDYAFSESLVNASVNYAISLAKEHMSSGEFEKNCQRITARIIKQPGVKRSEIGQYMKNHSLDSRQVGNVLKTLLDNEDILLEVERTTAGREIQRFFPSQKTIN